MRKLARHCSAVFVLALAIGSVVGCPDPAKPLTVATVQVTPAAASLYPAQTHQLVCEARSAEGQSIEYQSVTWTSSAPTVATVSGTGLVTAVLAGTATITATVEGKSGTASITVLSRDVGVVLETERAVSSTISSDGGQLSVIASDGTTLTLEVPSGALDDPQTLTLTPIQSLQNPLVTGIIAGVAIEPSGLQLMRPALLRVELPGNLPAGNVVGFAFSGPGEDFHWQPVTIEGTQATAVMAHFSGGGIAQVSPGMCAGGTVPGSFEAIARERGACYLWHISANGPVGPESSYWQEFVASMRTWYEYELRNQFGAVTNWPSLQSALPAWNSFASTCFEVEQNQNNPLRVASCDAAKSAFVAVVPWAVHGEDALCNNATGQLRVSHFKNLMKLRTLAMQWEPLSGHLLLDVDASFTCRLTLTLTSDPDPLVLEEGQSGTLTAVVLDAAGTPLQIGAVTWESSNPLIAVTATGARNGVATVSGRVSPNDRLSITATITAASVVGSGTATVTVIPTQYYHRAGEALGILRAENFAVIPDEILMPPPWCGGVPCTGYIVRSHYFEQSQKFTMTDISLTWLPNAQPWLDFQYTRMKTDTMIICYEYHIDQPGYNASYCVPLSEHEYSSSARETIDLSASGSSFWFGTSGLGWGVEGTAGADKATVVLTYSFPAPWSESHSTTISVPRNCYPPGSCTTQP